MPSQVLQTHHCNCQSLQVSLSQRTRLKFTIALKKKDQIVTAQANTLGVPPAIEASGDFNDQSSSSSDDIIYTPPESATDNMASPLGSKDPSPSIQANKAKQTTDTSLTMTAATHGPISTLQDPSSANISKREYIYFLPYPLPPNTEMPYSIHLPHKNPLNLPSHQFEPTSTVVLTSPNKTFVDIRIYKFFGNNSTPGSTPTALPSAAFANLGDPQRLDWAFAGTSSSVPIALPPSGLHHGKSKKRLEKETWANVTHSTWTHWVDSRHPVGSPDIPVDEGDMYPIARELTLEVGHGFHPALSAVKTHEEMWRDEDVASTNKGGSKVCVVMRCQADAVGVRGVVIRLGHYCQGILMHGSKTTVERWEWKDEHAGEDEAEKWKREVRVGDGFLPCGVAFRPGVLGVGAVVKFHDFEWVVEECWEWK